MESIQTSSLPIIAPIRVGCGGRWGGGWGSWGNTARSIRGFTWYDWGRVQRCLRLSVHNIHRPVVCTSRGGYNAGLRRAKQHLHQFLGSCEEPELFKYRKVPLDVLLTLALVR